MLPMNRMWLHYYNFKGVTATPINSNVNYPYTLQRGVIYSVSAHVFTHALEIGFYDQYTGSRILSLRFVDMQDFTKLWEILDRRILVEKTMENLLKH